MKHTLFILFAAVLLSCCCTACHKTCTCYTLNGMEVEYSPEELDEIGRNCQNMEYLNHGLSYVYCEW